MTALKVSAGQRYVRVFGVGGYRPSRVVTNAEICEKIDSTDEWIQTRSGIRTRHWADEDETLADMATAAATKALAHAGVTPDQIGCVVLATFTHLMQLPAAATEVADRLGVRCAAFDMAAGCAGFSYGMAVATGLINAGSAEYVLVIGAERMSDLLDTEDRATAFIFGDGAGAVVVGPSNEPGVGPVSWGSDGSKADLIRQTAPWDAVRADPGIRWPAISQDGPKVFRWAAFEVGKVAQQAMDEAGVTAEDLDCFIPHQANTRIIDSMAKQLKLPERVTVARDIVDTGNTSGASIPLAMEQVLSTGQAASGDLALIVGFGSGLTYAAMVVRLP